MPRSVPVGACLRRFFVRTTLVSLTFFCAAAQAKDTRLTAIALFDTAGGPADIQIAGLTVNGKTDVRVCDGIAKFDKRIYDTMARIQLAGASSLERSADGELKLTVSARTVCVVPGSLKFDRNAEITPGEAAEQAIMQGLAVASSVSGSGLPAFKPGVRLVFVPAADNEFAEFLLAQRAHSLEAWDSFLTHYSSSSRTSEAKNALASIYEESAELAFAEYRKSGASKPDFEHLKQAQQQADQAEKVVAGFVPARKIREQVSKELDALLESDRAKLQAFRKALVDRAAGYAQLTAARQHLDVLAGINPQYAPLLALRSEVANEQRKLDSTQQSAETLLASRRYDEALATVSPYRGFAAELPRVEAIISAVYVFHLNRGQEFAKSQTWEQALTEFRKAAVVRSDSKEAAAAVANAESQLSISRNRSAAERAIATSNSLAEKGQFLEAYEALADLPDAQQPFVADRLAGLQKNYVAAAFRKAQKLQEIHIPIRGRADEDAIRQAYGLLERASGLSGDPAMKLKLDLLSDKISAYYVEQAKRYLEKPMASGIGMGWLYLGEAEHFRPNLSAVKEAMARYAPAYQLRARLSLGVMLRDQTSRRDSVGFADQMRDAIATGLESSGLSIKVVRQLNEGDKDAVQPNFLLIGEILEHRVVKNASLETLQSKYRAGTHEVKNPAWLQANNEADAAQQQLASAQRELAEAQAQHKKKEIVSSASEALTAAQKQAADSRHKLETTDQTRSENVIETYNYTKKSIDLAAVVDMAFRITDQSGNAVEPAVPIRKDDHKIAVVLDNVKPEDTEGVKKQSTDPDEMQFLTDLEIQARDALVKSVREKALLLPARIVQEARARAQRGDLDGAAEEYVLYLNAVVASSPELQEATKFLQQHFNVGVAGGSQTTEESKLHPIN